LLEQTDSAEIGELLAYHVLQSEEQEAARTDAALTAAFGEAE
jgi:hypothetical protein